MLVDTNHASIAPSLGRSTERCANPSNRFVPHALGDVLDISFICLIGHSIFGLLCHLCVIGRSRRFFVHIAQVKNVACCSVCF